MLRGCWQWKHTSNKTEAVTKSINMYIWVVGTLNQLCIVVLIPKLNFQEAKVVGAKTPLLEKDPFCSTHSTFLTAMLLTPSRIWRKGLLCMASGVVSHQTRWYNKRIYRKIYSVPWEFSWIKNYKTDMDILHFQLPYFQLKNNTPVF